MLGIFVFFAHACLKPGLSMQMRANQAVALAESDKTLRWSRARVILPALRW
jgi:hypothetical protein